MWGRGSEGGLAALFLRCAECFGLLLEEDFNAICGPDGDAGAEEVGVLGPDGAGQGESGSENGTVTFVAAAQSLAGFGFKDTIELWVTGSTRLRRYSRAAVRSAWGLSRFLAK